MGPGLVAQLVEMSFYTKRLQVRSPLRLQDVSLCLSVSPPHPLTPPFLFLKSINISLDEDFKKRKEVQIDSYKIAVGM